MSDFFVVAICMALGAALRLNFGEPPREFGCTYCAHRSFSLDARGVLSITAALTLICTLAFLYPHHVRPYLQHDQFSMQLFYCSSQFVGPDLTVAIASDVSNQRRASVPG